MLSWSLLGHVFIEESRLAFHALISGIGSFFVGVQTCLEILAYIIGAIPIIFIGFFCSRKYYEIQYDRWNVGILRKEAETIITQQNGQTVIGVKDPAWHFQSFEKSRPARISHKKTEIPAIEMPEEISPAMPEIIRAQRCRITGVQDVGKSTIVQHVIDTRIEQGYRCLAFDTHAFRGGPGNNFIGKYPSAVKYYAEADGMEAGMSELTQMINNRYKKYKAGIVAERAFPFVFVCVDEMSELVDSFPKLALPFKFLLMSRARKVSVDFLESGQSGTAKSGGMLGRADMNQFDFALELKKVKENRYGIGTHGGDKTTKAKYELPGKYYPKKQVPDPFTNYQPEPKKDRPEPQKTRLEYDPFEPSEWKIYSYIQRAGGQVERKKLTTSKCLGNESKAKDYDQVILRLISAGRLDVRKIGKKAEWVYLTI